MKKRLERNKEKAVVSGVLVGLAEYFDHDPVLYRVLAVTFLIITGVFPGLLIYLAALFLIPKKNLVHADYEAEAGE